ncbi:hypothetical protein [Aurantimonas sp. VKM B-3413]|uniref:hypothetical protein n=1 Tax=Aurantimonas sp. VKM B-3413 TaxID=2779401 RepID=UPI001E2CAD99|nr:hypothetical protein [Aurantimonas sp. VKM B-3413]MCB8838381.1 hypothetical protein [Aurantimonas sp. VKM B-3413]
MLRSRPSHEVSRPEGDGRGFVRRRGPFLRRGLAAIAAAVLWPVLAAASPAGVMAGPGIAALVSGQTLDGIYSDGGRWNETYRPDGTLAYADRTGQAGGRWSVATNLFCTFYDQTNFVGGCFLVVRRSENCFDFYVVEPGSSGPSVPRQDIERAAGWSARGSLSGKATTCPVGLISMRAGQEAGPVPG